MATQLWEQEIDKNVDWGGDSSTGGAAVAGQYVQKFIKDTLAKKFGYLHYDRNALKYYVFADEEDYNKYANDTTGEFAGLLLATFDAPAPATINIEETSSQQVTILSTEKNQFISFKYIVKDSGSNPITEQVQARIQFNGGAPVIQNYGVDFENYQTGITQTFNLDNYLIVGKNTITVTLTGISTQATTVINFEYTVVELKLSSDFNNKIAIEIDKSQGVDKNYFAIPYSIEGQGAKYMEWYINGQPLDQTWVSQMNPDLEGLPFNYLASSNGTYSTNMLIYLTDNMGNLRDPFKFGKNTVQFRMYVEDRSSGKQIYSITKYYDFVITDPSLGAVTYILYSQDLGSGALFSPEDVITFTTSQYSATAFNYGLYSSTGSAVNLLFDLNKTENEITTNIASLTRSIVSGEVQTFEYTFLDYGKIDVTISTELKDNSGKPLDELHIAIDVAKAQYQIAVNKESLVLNLEALNRSNSEPNPATWKYRTIETQFNNVLWNTSSGWDGKSLVLNNGATAFIPLDVFAQYSSAGLTVEIDFETFNVKNENAVIFSLVNQKDSPTESKIELQACGADIRDGSNNTLGTNFNDEAKTKLAVIFNPYVKDTSTSSAKWPNTLFIVVNGILDRATSFNADALKWSNPQNAGILLGDAKSEAGIKVNSIRVYSKALSLDEELQNYIAESENLLALYEKNNIYEEGTENISMDILKNTTPTMIFYGNTEILNGATNKSNNIEVDVEYYDPHNPDLDFYARGAWMSCQGTSSMFYPKKNFRLYFGKTKDDKTLDTTAKYYTEVYLSGEFTHGQVNDQSKLGNFQCNKKTCKNEYHKLYTLQQAEQLEKAGTILFYKSETGEMLPCNYNDGSTNEYYISYYRPVKDDWKRIKELRYSGVTLYEIDGYSEIENPNTGVVFSVPVFKKLKGSKKLSEGKQYYVNQASWKQSLIGGWTDRWTLKTDYAESSMTHNAGAGRLWGNAMKHVIVSNSVADGYACRTNAQRAMGQFKDGIDIRTSCDGQPIVAFKCEIDPENPVDENGLRKYLPPEFIGHFNIMTDKGSTPLFGFEDIYDENGNKIFDASKVECWEASNNGSLFGQGVNLITDTDKANTFMGTRFVFSDYEPRWPDVEIEGPDGDEYLVAHTHNLESLWRFVNFCKPAVNYMVDGRDGYTMSEYVELPEDKYQEYVDNNKTVYVYDKAHYEEVGVHKYDQFNYSSVNDLYNNAPIYYLSTDIDYENVTKTLSDQSIEGHIYKGKVASFDAKHGTFVEDIQFDDERVDEGRVDYGDAIAGSEYEEDYYVNVYLIQEGSNRYKYVNEYGETVQYVGSVDRDVYEVNKNGESFAGKTYMEYFSEKKYDYFDVYKIAAYYVYLMRFAGVDQVVKNSMLTTEDGQHYYYINYDNDTTLGVRNDSSIKYHWNIDRNTYDYEVNQYAFAGPKSVLWNLLEMDEDFMNIVKRVDNAMYTSKVLSVDVVLDMYNNKQAGTWCERSYNRQEEIKYLSQGVSRLPAIHGSRMQHRSWWLKNRFNLFDSKWFSGEYASNTIKFYSQVQGTTNQLKDIFAITAARQNVFGLTNSDLDGAIPAEWGLELQIDETVTWNTNKNWNGVSSPFSIMGVDKIKVLDFRCTVEAGNSMNRLQFDGNNTNWMKNKGVMMTSLLFGISDEYRTAALTYRYTNNTDADITFKFGGNDIVLKPGEHFDSLDSISIPGTTMDILGATTCGAFMFEYFERLTTLEEVDIRNVFNKENMLNLDLTPLNNLHIYRAIGSSVTSFVPAEGVILNEVSLPQYNAETGHLGINTITLKNVKFTPAEEQTAPVLKYTPDSALRNVSFNNVTGINIPEFIETWVENLDPAAIELCTLSLENNTFEASVDWVLNTITKFNLTTFTGKIELVGTGEGGALTSDEYDAIVEQYGINVFNSTSSLVFNAREGIFWTINTTFVDDLSNPPFGLPPAESSYYEGIHGVKYSVKATIFPIDSSNKIHYELGIILGKGTNLGNEGTMSMGTYDKSNTKATVNGWKANRDTLTTITSNVNTGEGELFSSLSGNIVNDDKLFVIYPSVNDSLINKPVYINLKKVVIPEKINFTLDETEIVNNEIEITSKDTQTVTLNYNEGETSNVDISEFNVSINGGATETTSSVLSIKNIKVGKTLEECSFDIKPSFVEATEKVIEVKVTVKYNAEIGNGVVVRENTLKFDVKPIHAIGFDLFEITGLDEDGNEILSNPITINPKTGTENNIEIRTVKERQYRIKPYSAKSEEETNYFYNVDIVEVKHSIPTVGLSSVAGSFDETDILKFIISMTENQVNGEYYSFDDELDFTLTCTPSLVINNITAIENVYHLDASIIYPNQVTIEYPYSIGTAQGGGFNYTEYQDVTLRNITALNRKYLTGITCEDPANITADQKQTHTIPMKLVVSSNKAGISDPVNYEYDVQNVEFAYSKENIVECLFDKDKQEISIFVLPSTNTSDEIVVNVTGSVVYQINTVEKTLPIDISFTVNRSFAFATSAKSIKAEDGNIFLFDTNGNLYKVYGNSENDPATINSTLSAYDNETLDKIIGLVYFNHELKNTNINSNYVAIPLFADPDLYKENHKQRFLWDLNNNYDGNNFTEYANLMSNNTDGINRLTKMFGIKPGNYNNGTPLLLSELNNYLTENNLTHGGYSLLFPKDGALAMNLLHYSIPLLNNTSFDKVEFLSGKYFTNLLCEGKIQYSFVDAKRAGAEKEGSGSFMQGTTLVIPRAYEYYYFNKNASLTGKEINTNVKGFIGAVPEYLILNSGIGEITEAINGIMQSLLGVTTLTDTNSFINYYNDVLDKCSGSQNSILTLTRVRELDDSFDSASKQRSQVCSFAMISTSKTDDGYTFISDSKNMFYELNNERQSLLIYSIPLIQLD